LSLEPEGKRFCCVASGFICEVDGNCALPGRYAAYWIIDCLQMGLIGCPTARCVITPNRNSNISNCAYCCSTLDAGLLARSQYSEGFATGHLDTGFSWFPCVYKRMLRWFPRFQVATTCLSCSPPNLNVNLLVISFLYLYTC
jgi:hypothetical protein